jgi:hypothetical protein
VLSFGLAGLTMLLPSIRARQARRARQCTVCWRHQRVRRAILGGVAVILLAGVVTRISLSSGVTSRCDTARQVAASTAGMPTAWRLTRDVVTAPLTGIVDTYATARGM